MSSAVHEKPTQLSYLNGDADPAGEANHHDACEHEALPELHEGLSVNLATRALHLLGALRCYSDASSKKGLAIVAAYKPELQDRYARETINARAKNFTAEGNENFRRAWGAETMVAAGVDTVATNYYVIKDREDFMKNLVGPGNKARRAAYREKLQKHIDELKDK